MIIWELYSLAPRLRAAGCKLAEAAASDEAGDARLVLPRSPESSASCECRSLAVSFSEADQLDAAVNVISLAQAAKP